MTAVLNLLRQYSSGKHKRSERRRGHVDAQMFRVHLWSWRARLFEDGEAAVFPSFLSGWRQRGGRAVNKPQLIDDDVLAHQINNAFTSVFIQDTPNLVSLLHFKNAVWWLKVRGSGGHQSGAAAVWWLGNYHLSRPAQEPLDTQRTKLARRRKPAQSMKCNRWFRDELTLQPLTPLKNYLECTFEIMGGRCSSTVMYRWCWLADWLFCGYGSLLSLAGWI